MPGQGEPGVAIEYDGRVITYDDIEATSVALVELYSAPNFGEAATLLVLGPAAVEIAEAHGYTFTRDSAVSDALLWQSLQQQPQTQPTDDMIEVVTWTRAISTVLFDEVAAPEFVDLVHDIEANAKSSPRVGDFTFDKFYVSINAIQVEFNNRANELGPGIFTLFKDVNGYYSAFTPEWVYSKPQQSAVPSA